MHRTGRAVQLQPAVTLLYTATGGESGRVSGHHDGSEGRWWPRHKLVAIIQAEAAKKAAAGQRGQGAVLAFGAVALVVAGKHGWNAYTARRAASESSADAAAAELTALIEGSGADADAEAPPNEPEADGTAGKGGTGS